MERVVALLKKNYCKISTMESCTGGALASAITNIEGASEVFEFGAVTYSNFYKVEFGVDKCVIDQYSVYSKEVAREMGRAISVYTNSDYGVGITGKFNIEDQNNPYGENLVVYVGVYDRKENTYLERTIRLESDSRERNKGIIVEKVIDILLEIL